MNPIKEENMLRQAVRKTPRKPVRKPVKQAAKAAQKTPTTATTQSFTPRITSFVNHLGSFVEQRKKQTSTKDPIYKRLSTIHSGLKKELKKKNILNPTTAKHIKSLTPALRGVTKLPANIKGQAGKLMNFIRAEVNKDVLAFVAQFKTMLMPFQKELSKLEKELNANVKKAQSGKIQWKMDPSVKQHMNALNSHFTRYKKKWLARLSKINLNSNKQVQAQVKGLKKLIDDVQKSISRNQTIVNRYAKSVKPRAGYKTQALMNVNEIKPLESNLKNIDTACEKYRMKAEYFVDQLKAIKLF
jgi:hypothetical protein